MPIQGEQYPFTKDGIGKATNEPGVYALFQDTQLIYYGRAQDSVRSRLQSHLRGNEGRSTQAATDYQCEVTSNSVTRERELLDEFQKQHGGLPECNKEGPKVRPA